MLTFTILELTFPRQRIGFLIDSCIQQVVCTAVATLAFTGVPEEYDWIQISLLAFHATIIQVLGPCLVLVARTLERPAFPISKGHSTPLRSKYLSSSFATYLNDFLLAGLISITHHQLLRTTSGLHDSHGRNHDRRIAAICQCQCLSAPLLSNAYCTNSSSFSRSVASMVYSFVFCAAKRNFSSFQRTSSIQLHLQTYEMLLPSRQNDPIATIDIGKHSLDCYGSVISVLPRWSPSSPIYAIRYGILPPKPNEAIEQTKLFFEISCTIAAVILVMNIFLWLKLGPEEDGCLLDGASAWQSGFSGEFIVGCALGAAHASLASGKETSGPLPKSDAESGRTSWDGLFSRRLDLLFGWYRLLRISIHSIS